MNLIDLKWTDGHWRMPAYNNSHEELVVVHQRTLSGKMMRKNLRRVQGAPISCDLQKIGQLAGSPRRGRTCF